MTIAEGGGRRAVSHKLRDMYLPTLKANFMVWPLVQIINFRIMPLQFQLVSSSILSLAAFANIYRSPSYPPSVLLGRHTFLFRTLLKKPMLGLLLLRQISACSD